VSQRIPRARACTGEEDCHDPIEEPEPFEQPTVKAGFPEWGNTGDCSGTLRLALEGPWFSSRRVGLHRRPKARVQTAVSPEGLRERSPAGQFHASPTDTRFDDRAGPWAM